MTVEVGFGQPAAKTERLVSVLRGDRDSTGSGVRHEPGEAHCRRVLIFQKAVTGGHTLSAQMRQPRSHRRMTASQRELPVVVQEFIAEQSLTRLLERARRLLEKGANLHRLRQYVKRWVSWLHGSVRGEVDENRFIQIWIYVNHQLAGHAKR
jgi:hypothetical protein